VPLLLILIFIGVPILEIAVFIQAGNLIGLWPTLAVVVITAVLGAALLRSQGLAAVGRARRQLDRGEIPISEVATGICLLIAGALLLTPGFVTDAIGFLLLIPPVRTFLSRWAVAALMRGRSTRVWIDGEEIVVRRHGPDTRHADAIDVEYTDVSGPDGPVEPGRRPPE